MSIPSRPDTLSSWAGQATFCSGGAFTAWVNAWLRGAVSYDSAVSAIHTAGIRTVRGLPDNPEPAPVGWALGALRACGGSPLRLVLPVPGDVRGVPAVPGLPAAAIRAGQLVVGSELALLPEDHRSAGTDWTAWDATTGSAPVPATPGEQLTVAQAAGALRLAVLEATDVLASLDVARWSPAVDSLSQRAQQMSLPPDHDPNAAALAIRCTQLVPMLELANTDAPGGAISARAAAHRDAALRPLSVAVREALMTSFSIVCTGRTVDR
ncbi:MAG: hypothetical protein H0T54_08770 [Geodermatophilaceae bacterium]|nr:hypothetical protein [Geodermatophilaceae bacterium]